MRVAIVGDLLEEQWPSMDLVANRLHDELGGLDTRRLRVQMLRPTLRVRGRGIGRYVNRYWDYSRWLRPYAREFDVFHIVDHTYAHLAHVLPPGRTIVTCHDVDAFMPVLEPGVIRSRLPKAITKWVLSGMKKAAHVTCDSQATREDVRRFRLVDNSKLTVAYMGVETGLSAEPIPADDEAVDRFVGTRDDCLELLHVGTTIPRKRIDVLLRVVDAVKNINPRVRLLRAGGRFTHEQRAQIAALGLDKQIVELPFLDRPTLAALYRRAHLLLMTSDREGFGLPLVEAMACGTSTVVTDLPVLREVGGEAARYCGVDDTAGWRDTILELWRERSDADAVTRRRLRGIERAGLFTWPTFAKTMVQIYDDVAARATPQ